MKKNVVLLILSLVLIAGAAAADTLLLPEDTVVIGDEAFRGVDADTIILPPGVTVIGDAAFGYSETLRRVYVPESLLDREDAALVGSDNAEFVSLTHNWTAEYNYALNDDGNTIRITLYKGTDTEVSIPAIIEGKPVTEIGQSAFASNETITKVVIPEGVTKLGIDAFHSCMYLTDITFPSTLHVLDNNALYLCGSASESDFCFRLPDNLTEIAGLNNNSWYSFNGCPAIRVVTPDSATAKLLSAFQEKQKDKAWFTFPGELDFRYMYFPDTDGGYQILHLMKYVGTGNEVTIPDHGTASSRISVVHQDAFKENDTLTKVVIPEGVTEVGTDAFHSCVNLTEVTFPDTLHILGNNAFRYCGSNSDEAFCFCLPENLTEIAGANNNNWYSFNDCPAVKVVAPDCATAKLLSTFQERQKEKAWFTFPGEPEYRYIYFPDTDGNYTILHLMAYTGTAAQVNIPDHGTDFTRTGVLHNSIFRGNTTVTKVTIPEGVTEIQYDVFFECSALAEVDFPDTLTTIGRNAFNGCSSAVEGNVFFDLPAGITLVEYDAFNNCKAKLCCDRYSDSAGTIPTATYEALGSRWWGWADGPFRLKDCQVPFTVTTETENGTFTHTEYANRYMLGGYVPEQDTAGPLTVRIPEMVYIIGDDCFRGMTNLEHVVMPAYEWQEGDYVTRYVNQIGARAFMGCLNLTDITFSPLLTSIGENAFSGCGNNSIYPYIFEFHYPQSTLAGLERHDNDPNNIVYTFPGCNAQLLIHWTPVLN